MVRSLFDWRGDASATCRRKKPGAVIPAGRMFGECVLVSRVCNACKRHSWSTAAFLVGILGRRGEACLAPTKKCTNPASDRARSCPALFPTPPDDAHRRHAKAAAHARSVA